MTDSQIHDREKLPKWAQKMIWELECRIDGLEGLRQAHAVLMGKRNWFTLRFHDSSFEGREFRTLYFLESDSANSLCSLGKNDIVLIGRGVKSEEDA